MWWNCWPVVWSDGRLRLGLPRVRGRGRSRGGGTEGQIGNKDTRSSDRVGWGGARHDSGKWAMRATVNPYPELPRTNYRRCDMDPGLVRVVQVADLDLDRPRRLVGVTRHDVSPVEVEPPCELLSGDRCLHRDVETVVSYFHPCDAGYHASAISEPSQIPVVNLAIQQGHGELLEFRRDRDGLSSRFGRGVHRARGYPAHVDTLTERSLWRIRSSRS
jgi:hypothetical protein